MNEITNFPKSQEILVKMLLDAKNTCIFEMKQAKKFAFKAANIAFINQKIKDFEQDKFT